MLTGRWLLAGALPAWLRGLGLRLGLAAALASQAVAGPAAPQPLPLPLSVPDTLAQRLQPCMACHGAQGRASRLGYLPRIAGKPAAYLYQQLLGFRDGRRSHATMAGLLAHQTDAYLREMAEHFAALDLPHNPPPAVNATAAELARGRQLALQGDTARQLPACTACHGQALNGSRQAVPGLLGLPRDYLIGQLGAWQTGSRRALAPDCMADISRRLAPADASAVAAWLAAQAVPPGPPAATTGDQATGLRCGSIEAAR